MNTLNKELLDILSVHDGYKSIEDYQKDNRGVPKFLYETATKLEALIQSHEKTPL